MILLLVLASTRLSAQTPARLTFEVASVKPAAADQRGGGIKALPGGQRYEARNVPLKLIISLMFKIPLDQISGGPAWINTERWDIEAKAAHSYNLDDLHTMFQNLLVDEFKLKYHIESKEGRVYALMQEKGGSKMALNESPEDFKVPINGFTMAEITGVRVPMKYFCWWLSTQGMARLDRPVIDKTGLEKFYDFKLSFAPELPPGMTTEKLPAGVLDRPSLFTALKEQLGLKLEPQKGPVEVLVVDHLEKAVMN